MSDTYVRADGCIRLGKHVTCDGFSPDAMIRIQSHAHSDHLGCFPRSKGNQQKIVMTEPTKKLLIAEKHPDLTFRTGQLEIIPTDGKYRQVLGVEIALFPSAHMVGSAMASVKFDEKHYVYTGDFGGQIELFPQNPDVLVIDATYGNPAYVRDYNQSEVIDKFIEIASNIIRSESLAITGYRGRLQRAAQILHASNPNCPFIFSPYVHKTFHIYAEYRGFTMDGYLFGTKESREIIKNKQYVLFIDHRESNILDQIQPLAKIELSAYMVPRQDPVLEKESNKRYRIALTDHADFRDTILLIKEIQPKFVIADGSRNGNPQLLAEYVEQELGIPATAKVFPCKREWGFH